MELQISGTTSLKRKPARCISGLLCLSVLAIVLSGCTSQWEDSHAYMVGAEALFPAAESSTVKSWRSDDAEQSPKEYLGLVIVDSEAKCDRFLNRLSVAESSGDTGLDMATGVFSALSTAFTPLSTVHALSAASTITSGWKTAIDSDYYAKATIANYAQAIQASYYADMKTYSTALNAATDPLIVPIELSTILRIHAECSLESAQNTISSTLQASANPGSSKSSVTLTITGSLTTNEVLKLTAAAKSFKAPVSVTYNTGADSQVADAAEGLANAVNGNSEMTSAGVAATHPIAAPGNTVVLSWPSSLSIIWTAPAQIKQAASPMGRHLVSSAAAISVGAIQVQSAPTDRSGSVPGHSLQY
jgi:hypothetical protein